MVPADTLSPTWTKTEALNLLGRIQQDALSDGPQSQGKVLLAGYGFGGIVVKQVRYRLVLLGLLIKC